jgi:hypothetical protein
MESCPPGYSCRSTHAGSASGPTIQVCRVDTSDGGLPVDGGGPDDADYEEDAYAADAAPDAVPSNQ